MGKTFQQKLHHNKESLPEVKEITNDKLIAQAGVGKMVIPAPLEINEKFPGGVEGQIKKLENEGHKIVKRGKKFFVLDYESALFKL